MEINGLSYNLQHPMQFINLVCWFFYILFVFKHLSKASLVNRFFSIFIELQSSLHFSTSPCWTVFAQQYGQNIFIHVVMLPLFAKPLSLNCLVHQSCLMSSDLALVQSYYFSSVFSASCCISGEAATGPGVAVGIGPAAVDAASADAAPPTTLPIGFDDCIFGGLGNAFT